MNLLLPGGGPDLPLENCQWKLINLSHSDCGQMWATCYWKSDSDSVLDGQGLIYSDKKNNEFLVGGVFSKGALITNNKYFRIFQKGFCYLGEMNPDFEPHGFGELIVSEDESYKGYFNRGIPHGKGCKKTKGKEFTGKFKNGELVSGVEKTEKGSYEGEFNNFLKHGKGILRMNNGLVYEGEFSNNRKNGMGTLKNK